MKNLKKRLDELEERAEVAAAGEEYKPYVSFAGRSELLKAVEQAEAEAGIAGKGRPREVKAYITVSPDDWPEPGKQEGKQ